MSIKIFLSYHRNTTRIVSDILTPMHVGRSTADKNNLGDLSDMIGDDTGDNISSKNQNYCELTAQYWAWKNCNADYIGFMHYRRHLSFNIKKTYRENIWGLVEYDYINEHYLNNFMLKDNDIKKVVENYDIITVKEWNVENSGSKNNYEHYRSSNKKLHVKDYNIAVGILEEKYPDYRKDIKNYNASNIGYYTNIFVMKRKLFMEYSDFLFNILFELENKINILKYDKEEARVFGYISEWLFGIYIYHLKRVSDKRIGQLQRTIVRNADIVQNKEHLNICFASDNNYSQHLAAAIVSILKNTKTKMVIDIYILNGGIKDNNIAKIEKLKYLYSNLSVNFYFINMDNDKFRLLKLRDNFHVTLSTYYRYVIPSIFNCLSKIIYLDCDLIVLEDIELLYNINVNNYYMAAVQDLIGFENQRRLKINKEKKYLYCNAGVLLINLEECRKYDLERRLFIFTLKYGKKLLYLDQDAINVVCEKKIKYLDLSWNLQYYLKDTKSDYSEKDFDKAIRNPKIIHFIGEIKPWDINSERHFKSEYFKYLKLTPYGGFYYKYLLKSFSFKIKRFIYHKYDEYIYRKRTVLGINISTKPIDLKLDSIYNKLNELNHTHNRALELLNKKTKRYYTNLESRFNTVNKRFNKIDSILNESHNLLFAINGSNVCLSYYSLNKIKEVELKEKVLNGGKIKVLFLISYLAKFGFESVYDTMIKDSIFDPYIFVCHPRDTLFDKEPSYFDEALKTYELLKSRKYKTIFAYDFITKKPISMNILDPDIIFFNNPNLYEFSIYKNAKLNKDFLTCYIDYSVYVVDKYDYKYNNVYVNTAWINFAENYFTYREYLNNKNANVVLTGYPKLDSYSKPIDECVIPKKIDNCKKIVIYAPHWTIKNISDIKSTNLGTFHLYHKYFMSLLKSNPTINFVFKPHPDLPYRIIDSKLMDYDYYQNYIKEWNNSSNGVYINEGEYIDLFRKSYCLITDSGSFIAEYLPTKNPCIYLVNPEEENVIENTFNSFAKNILNTYYLAYNDRDINKYFNMVVIEENDCMKEKRLSSLEDSFINIGSAGKNITEYIKNIFLT